MVRFEILEHEIRVKLWNTKEQKEADWVFHSKPYMMNTELNSDTSFVYVLMRSCLTTCLVIRSGKVVSFCGNLSQFSLGTISNCLL